MEQGYKILGGNATVTNSGATGTVITCPTSQIPGATAKLYLIGGNISVTTAATGGGGVVNILDGSTVIFSVPAAAAGSFQVYFGESGYPMTPGNNITISVTGAVSNQASAGAALTSYVVGG